MAKSPTRTDSHNAARTWESRAATANQCPVNPPMGQLSMVDLLNAYNTIRTIGTNRNAKTSPTQIRSATRRPWFHSGS